MKNELHKNGELYKGYFLVAVRHQENSPRVAAWRAYRTDGIVLCEYKTKAMVKKFIRILHTKFEIKIG